MPVFLFEMFTFGSILFIKKKIISRHAQARLDTTDSFINSKIVESDRAEPCGTTTLAALHDQNFVLKLC